MTSRGPSSADALAARLAASSRLVADQLATSLPAARAALGGRRRWLRRRRARGTASRGDAPAARPAAAACRHRRLALGRPRLVLGDVRSARGDVLRSDGAAGRRRRATTRRRRPPRPAARAAAGDGASLASVRRRRPRACSTREPRAVGRDRARCARASTTTSTSGRCRPRWPRGARRARGLARASGARAPARADRRRHVSRLPGDVGRVAGDRARRCSTCCWPRRRARRRTCGMFPWRRRS
jgi:hypothetical protein